MQNNVVTERLKLDLLTLQDHDFIRTLVNTKGWIEFIGERNVYSKEDAIAYINRILNMDNIFYWVVKISNQNTPIGIISFIKRSYLDNFDIGFAFLPEFNGMGYAYEAAKAILSMVSNDPSYYPVLATTIPRNITSTRLLTKLGLHFEREIEVDDEKLHLYTNAATNE